MASSTLISDTEPWKDLKGHVEEIKQTHLRDLMDDSTRCKSMTVEFDGILLDYSRQRIDQDTMEKLFRLAEAARLKQKIDSMYSGEHVDGASRKRGRLKKTWMRVIRIDLKRCDPSEISSQERPEKRNRIHVAVPTMLGQGFEDDDTI